MSQLYDTARNAYWRFRGLPLPPLVMRGHTDTIWSVTFLPDGKQVISGSWDKSIGTWGVEDGDKVGMVMKEEDPVYAVAASSDGRWIATGGRAKTITVWDVTTHKKVVKFEGHSDLVWSLAFSPDSARVASGSGDNTVIVWNTTTGERLAGPLEGHTHWVDCVQFSPDGERLATCGGDLRVWHSHTTEFVIPPIEVNALSLAWTPNGQQLIVGCYDGSIKFFDASTRSQLAIFNGHTYYVYSIAVSANGRFFASGSRDTTVRLWDTTTRQQVGPALQHDRIIRSVAISPGGRHLATGGDDNILRIWNLQHIVPQSLIESTPTNTSTNVCDEVVDLKQVTSSPAQEASHTRNGKDDDTNEKVAKKAEKDNLEEVETTLQRRPSESSSLRNFLDGPALVPIKEIDHTSDPLYADFFKHDSPDAQRPVDEAPKNHISEFLNKLFWKKKDQSTEMQTQPEGQRTIPASEVECHIDPLSVTAPQQLAGNDNGKQKESDPDATPAADTDRGSGSSPTPEPKLAAAASHTMHQARNGFSAPMYDRSKVTYVAYGHMDDLVATCEDYPDDDEGSLCRAVFDLICYCGRGRYIKN
ncbi:WD40 repeat-like protein [Paxillus ammoniavirescens]|nr:WD40 repeat-like protein [Paxillus ammoniavirescens]